jgi:hypothetical protein
MKVEFRKAEADRLYSWDELVIGDIVKTERSDSWYMVIVWPTSDNRLLIALSNGAVYNKVYGDGVKYNKMQEGDSLTITKD